MWEYVRALWRSMLTAPWQETVNFGPLRHILVWTLGWLWSLLGLILGAFIATPILRQVGLQNTPLQDWATYGIALLSAFVVQLASFGVWALIAAVGGAIYGILPDLFAHRRLLSEMEISASLIIFGLLSLAGESYVLYRFIQTQNVNQGLVTTYVIGGFILKAIVLPVIKSLAVAIFVKPILRWIRGSDSKTQKAD